MIHLNFVLTNATGLQRDGSVHVKWAEHVFPELNEDTGSLLPPCNEQVHCSIPYCGEYLQLGEYMRGSLQSNRLCEELLGSVAGGWRGRRVAQCDADMVNQCRVQIVSIKLIYSKIY